ncbi:MAG: glycosyltransferase family 2 protein [Candidatus Binatia bacterium]
MRVDVIIPALNEVRSVADVVHAVRRPPVRSVFVVDNGSTDGTGEAARRAGAQVVVEPRRGYGSACLAGIRQLPADTDVVVFIDADGSDEPALLPVLLRPIADGQADFVVGARGARGVERGALTRPQRVGNALASRWLRARFGLPATDLGPFRAIRRSALDAIGMSDRDYGWTVEMQIKAARAHLRYQEVPVPYRRRVGVSKISGTMRGTIGAALKIVTLLARYDFLRVGRA